MLGNFGKVGCSPVIERLPVRFFGMHFSNFVNAINEKYVRHHINVFPHCFIVNHAILAEIKVPDFPGQRLVFLLK